MVIFNDNKSPKVSEHISLQIGTSILTLYEPLYFGTRAGVREFQIKVHRTWSLSNQPSFATNLMVIKICPIFRIWTWKCCYMNINLSNNFRVQQIIKRKLIVQTLKTVIIHLPGTRLIWMVCSIGVLKFAGTVFSLLPIWQVWFAEL